MEHDGKCEFGTWGHHWVHLDFLTEEELGVLRAHYLCFCARRRRGERMTGVEEGALKDRWRLVRDNYRDKTRAEERARAIAGFQGSENDGLGTVIKLDDFRKRRNAQSPDDARD